MTDRLIQHIDQEIERRSLLKHPFYRMWSNGELTVAQIAGYSKEYFQLVKRVPTLVENIQSMTRENRTRDEIQENLDEEKSHIEPWIRFATSLGVARTTLEEYAGSSTTNTAVSQLDQISRSSFEQSVAAMYAYEMELPKISRSKIDGLEKFYGMTSQDATEYFKIHEVADIKHAALWRRILSKTSKEDEELLASAAVRSLEAQNKLLDSVMEKYCE